MGGDYYLACVHGLTPQFFPIFLGILWAVVRHSKVQVLCGFRVPFRIKSSLGSPNKTEVLPSNHGLYLKGTECTQREIEASVTSDL
jgi:hypothetical protein